MQNIISCKTLAIFSYCGTDENPGRISSSYGVVLDPRSMDACEFILKTNSFCFISNAKYFSTCLQYSMHMITP